MLEALKQSLLISGSDFDSQIQRYIATVKADLIANGMASDRYDATDPRVIACTELYCLYMFNVDNRGSYFQGRYQEVLRHLVTERRYVEDAG